VITVGKGVEGGEVMETNSSSSTEKGNGTSYDNDFDPRPPKKSMTESVRLKFSSPNQFFMSEVEL
jgi:hypothetical protein